MPELPEAETIVRTLAPYLLGRKFLGVQFRAKRAKAGRFPSLEGRSIQDVRRYGKQILLTVDGGFLIVDLRMTGSLIWDGQPGPYTRALLVLDNGTVCFNDIRQFGSIRWLLRPPDHLGPDPFEISAVEFVSRLRSRRSRVKPLLLNQRFVRGLGNIYVDEILFRAAIHPQAFAARVAAARAVLLHQAMLDVLRTAIENGGSSISDYVNANNQRGSFQLHHQVYGREGQECYACHSLVKRIVVSQRGTHYCPKCQKK